MPSRSMKAPRRSRRMRPLRGQRARRRPVAGAGPTPGGGPALPAGCGLAEERTEGRSDRRGGVGAQLAYYSGPVRECRRRASRPGSRGGARREGHVRAGLHRARAMPTATTASRPPTPSRGPSSSGIPQAAARRSAARTPDAQEVLMLTSRSGLSPFERLLTLFTRVRPGEGRSALHVHVARVPAAVLLPGREGAARSLHAGEVLGGGAFLRRCGHRPGADAAGPASTVPCAAGSTVRGCCGP